MSLNTTPIVALMQTWRSTGKPQVGTRSILAAPFPRIAVGHRALLPVKDPPHNLCSSYIDLRGRFIGVDLGRDLPATALAAFADVALNGARFRCGQGPPRCSCCTTGPFPTRSRSPLTLGWRFDGNGV